LASGSFLAGDAERELERNESVLSDGWGRNSDTLHGIDEGPCPVARLPATAHPVGVA
jgi:hypothetical protein